MAGPAAHDERRPMHKARITPGLSQGSQVNAKGGDENKQINWTDQPGAESSYSQIESREWRKKMKSTRKFLIVAAVVLGLVMGSVGIAYAITNGQPDGDDHPYVGLLVFDVGGVPRWRCSGALIAPDVVLTAGHCTDGAVAARVWFDEVVEGNPDYPWGGPSAVEGTPYTNPKYRSDENPYGGGNGLPAFSYRDVGVVVLTEPVPTSVVSEYAVLPTAGFVDTLKNKTDVDLVGYGVQEEQSGLD